MVDICDGAMAAPLKCHEKKVVPADTVVQLRDKAVSFSNSRLEGTEENTGRSRERES